jgi:hypothetical protein
MTSLLKIRRPTAPPPEEAGAPAFRLNGSPRGVRIGVRAEPAWRSWLFISALWTAWLERDGATVRQILTGERSGEAAAHTRAALDTWAGSVDAAVVGIGT